MSKLNKIRHIVRIQQMLKHWRHKARANNKATLSSSSSSDSSSSSPEVPAGHVAVYVGASGQRFVVRARYLNHPIFQSILARAEEEYGFKNDGPLRIPCEEWEFEEILRFVSRSDSNKFVNNNYNNSRCSYSCNHSELVGPPSGRPLLRG